MVCQVLNFGLSNLWLEHLAPVMLRQDAPATVKTNPKNKL